MTLSAAFSSHERIHDFACTFYTAESRATGTMRSAHWRLSDAMNARDEDFILLLAATVEPIDPRSDSVRHMQASSLLLRRNDILLAMHNDSEQAVQYASRGPQQRVARNAIPTLVELAQFSLSCTVHVMPGVEFVHFADLKQDAFMPATAVTVRHPTATLEADFILVSRQHIRLIVDLSEATLSYAAPRPASEGGAGAGLAPLPLTGPGLAALFGALDPFRDEDAVLLRDVCAKLVQDGHAARWQVPPQAAVVRQGAPAGQLGLVESGLLGEVHAAQSRLIYLGPGDLFGAIPSYGTPTYPATVQGVEPAEVLLVDQAGGLTLARFFPAAVALGLRLLRDRGALPPPA